jgi:formylglycine-generating enzyme required for sulfatase activity
MIAKPFAVGKFAVTVDEFDAFIRDSGYKTVNLCKVFTGNEVKDYQTTYRSPPGLKQTGSHPVLCVNWDDARAYTAWLLKRTGQSYRLLSDAEREYVTRAGTTTPFWWGSEISPDQANYDGRRAYAGGAQGEYRGNTVPVKSFQPNFWGLYQVHGNAWEWTQDCWNDTYSGAPNDGSARTTGDCSKHVIRGGSLTYSPARWLYARTENTRGADREGCRINRPCNGR